jgi:tellurite resistance protein
MRLDSDALLRLRQSLRERGKPSLTPPSPVSTPRASLAEASPELRAAAERVAPICELLYLMMSVDGACTSEERDLLRGAIRALTDGQLRSAMIDDMLAGFDDALLREGRSARLAFAAARLSADRADAEAAFSLAAAIALADSSADPRELAMLEELGDMLGLPAARRQTLTDGD